MKVKSLFLILLFLFCSMDGGACELWEKIQKEGVLVAATDPNYPPFESLGEKSELTGFDIDLVRMLAVELGLKAKFKTMRFDEIFSDVLSGDVDLGVSCISITENRSKNYTFSHSYYRSAQMVMISPASKIYTLDDLAGKLVYAQRGSTGAEMAEKIAGAKVRLVDDFTPILNLMERGEQVAIVADRALADHYRKERGFLTVGSPLSFEQIAIMMVPNCPELKVAVNGVLLDLTNRGEIRKLRAKWDL